MQNTVEYDQAWFISPLAFGIGGFLADTEDHKFCGFHNSHADLANQAAIVEIVLGHGAAVATHEVGFVRLAAQQRTALPLGVEEALYGFADIRPERRAVVLEHRP